MASNRRPRVSVRPPAAEPARVNLASVVPSVMTEALRLADGDKRRIIPLSETEVIVK